MTTAEDVKKVLDGRREFTFEIPGQEPIVAYIASPTGEDLRKADWQYAKIYNQAIVDGFLTQSQMAGFLKDKGIVDDAYSSEVEGVRMQLATKLYTLESSLMDGSEQDKEALALEISRLRDDLFRLNQKVNGPMGNTCENIAEDTRVEFLTSRIIQKKDRTPLWKSYEDYQKDDNVALAVKARFEVMLWMQGLESNFLENTPEQVALRQIAQARLDRIVAEQKKENEEVEALEEAKKTKTSSKGKKVEAVGEVEEALPVVAPVESEPADKKTTVVKVKKAGRPKKDLSA